MKTLLREAPTPAKDPDEVERFLKVQPRYEVPRRQLGPPAAPGGLVARQLCGHRVIRDGQ